MGEPDAVMADAVKNLRIRWVLRQQLGTAQKSWLVDIFETDHERLARQKFEQLKRDDPDAYFELVAVLHSEVAIDWSGRIKAAASAGGGK